MTNTPYVEFTGDWAKFRADLYEVLHGYRPLYTDFTPESFEAFADIENLIDVLDHRSEPGFWFGPHPLEPMVYGYWPNSLKGNENEPPSDQS